MNEKYIWRTIGTATLTSTLLLNICCYQLRQAKNTFYTKIEQERLNDTKHTCNEILLRYNIMSTTEREYVDQAATNLRTLRLKRLEEALEELKQDFPDHLPKAERKGQGDKW